MLAPVRHDAICLSDLNVHCLDYGADGPPVLLLHSLSGNTRLFDGLIGAGLAQACRVLVPDLRGRGRSDMPLTGYSLDAGCSDILSLLDHFGLDRIALCGHSFGGLLALYFAAHYPERVTHLAMLDAAVQMPGHAAHDGGGRGAPGPGVSHGRVLSGGDAIRALRCAVG